MSEHTEGKLKFLDQGEACEYCLVTDDNRWVISFRLNGGFMPLAQQNIARRLVACWNACEGIQTEKIEGRTIADYVTSEAFLTGMTVVDGVNMGIKGLACQMLAEKFAGQFVGNGAVNFLELTMVSEETGPLIVTIQRKHGKTPAQLKAEVEQQRDELLQELRNIANADTLEWDDRTEFEAWAKSRARAAIAKAEAGNA